MVFLISFFRKVFLLFLLAAVVSILAFFPATPCPAADKQNDETDQEKEEKGYFSYYGQRLGFLSRTYYDRWGFATPLPPKGFFSINFSTRFLRWDSRFNEDGDIGRVIDPVDFMEPSLNNDDFFSLKINAKGSSQFHDLSLAYGITDSLNISLNVPMAFQNNSMTYNFSPGRSAPLGIRSTREFIDFLEALGRPRPVSRYESKAWEMGDINIEAGWNFFRNNNFSSLFFAKVFFPSGRLAEPNQALIYGLGPDRDTGKGSFGFGAGFGFDFRPPEPAGFMFWSLKGDYSYRFKGKRFSPSLGKPDQASINSLEAFGVNTDYFPDISNMDDYYYVTPGSAFAGLGYWGFDFKYANFGFGYEFSWAQEPDLDSNSVAYEKMLDLFDSYTEELKSTAMGAVRVPMYHYHVPLEIYFEARYPLFGNYALFFEDDYRGGARLFIPF